MGPMCASLTDSSSIVLCAAVSPSGIVFCTPSYENVGFRGSYVFGTRIGNSGRGSGKAAEGTMALAPRFLSFGKYRRLFADPRWEHG